MPGLQLALDRLSKKLAFLLEEEVTTVDAEAKYAIGERIKAVEAKIQRYTLLANKLETLRALARPSRPAGWIAIALTAVVAVAGLAWAAAAVLRPDPPKIPPAAVPDINVLVQNVRSEPLDEAVVWAVLPGGGQEKAEESDGAYVFASLPEGDVEICASKEGYKKECDEKVSIALEGMKQVTLQLEK